MDTAPYEIPADDPTLQTDMDAKTTVYSWRDDYDDITDDKSLSTAMPFMSGKSCLSMMAAATLRWNAAAG